MATEKPRITITLEPDQHEVLRRLAALQGRPMSRIIAELLAEVTPTLGRVADSLEIAMRSSEDVRTNLRRVAQEAETEMAPMLDAVLSQFDLFHQHIDAAREVIDEAAKGKGAAGAADADTGAAGAVESPRPVITGATEVQRATKQPRKRRRAGSGGGSETPSRRGV